MNKDRFVSIIKSTYSFLWRLIVVLTVFFVFVAVWMIALYAFGDAGAFVYRSGIIFGSYDFLGFDILGFVLSICAGLFTSWLLNERKLKQILLFWGKAVIVTGIVLLISLGGEYLINLYENNKINRFIKNADEIIYYEDATTVYGGIMNTQFEKSVILIDYDSMGIAFLCSGDMGYYNEFKLIKTDYLVENTNLQIKVNSSFPGQTLTSYYPNEASNHRTTAIQIVMEDGSIYSISGIKDKDTGYDCYLGLKWSKHNVERDGYIE